MSIISIKIFITVKMMKKIPYFLIKKNFVYSTKELAKELRVCEKTIRRFTTKGMPHFDDCGSHLFYGKQVKDFLKDLYTNKKVKLGKDEFYCFTCKTGVKAFGIEHLILLGQNVRVRLFGQCISCGKQVNKITSLKNFQTVYSNINSKQYTPLICPS